MIRSWCAAAARGILAAAILAAGVPLLLATAAQAQGLRLGYVEFPPYTYTDADGRAAGSVIDLATAVFANAGYSLASAQSAPARRVIQGVAEGEYDVFLGIKTPEPFAAPAPPWSR